MEDKTFELLEKIYLELRQFKQETNERFDGIDSKFDGIDSKFDGIDSRFDGIDSRLDRVEGRIVKIENDHGQKLNALLDGYKQNSEAITQINHKLDRLTDRVENQEIKLQVLKSVK
ncbi:MAG: hypothetical protein GX053_06610 [Tissierella sp.]|nr:hypothetical protein [Tissierella sp.]